MADEKRKFLRVLELTDKVKHNQQENLSSGTEPILTYIKQDCQGNLILGMKVKETCDESIRFKFRIPCFSMLSNINFDDESMFRRQSEKYKLLRKNVQLQEGILWINIASDKDSKCKVVCKICCKVLCKNSIFCHIIGRHWNIKCFSCFFCENKNYTTLYSLKMHIYNFHLVCQNHQ